MIFWSHTACEKVDDCTVHVPVPTFCTGHSRATGQGGVALLGGQR